MNVEGPLRVLVTGGTGFVGAWTAKAAQDAGHRVRFLVRSVERLRTSAAKIGVDIGDHVVGDIADPASTATALQGCDAVIHCAAMVSTDPARAEEMLFTNLEGARNVLGGAVQRGIDPVVHVSSFSALFRPGLETLHADLPVVGGSDGYGKSKAVVEAYARGLQDAGAPVSISYPGMVLGPPAGDQFGEAAEGVAAAIRMHGVPGRSAAWIVIDVRDLADLHVALLAHLLGDAANTTLVAVPVPDSGLRALGRLFDVIGDRLPFDTPIDSAAMQYYTQMPASDDGPAERELGITQRDPAETLADTVAGLREVGRI
jgi:dihydroflavonol-4-reductase